MRGNPFLFKYNIFTMMYIYNILYIIIGIVQKRYTTINTYSKVIKANLTKHIR